MNITFDEPIKLNPECVFHPLGPNGEPTALSCKARIGCPQEGDVYMDTQGRITRNDGCTVYSRHTMLVIFTELHEVEQDGSGI